MTFSHYSVLLHETIEGLHIRENGIYVDGTLGGGGHALAVVKRLGSRGRLIGIDQDSAAIKAAEERLRDYRDHVTIVRSNYENLPQVLRECKIEKADGIYLDLGVSSYQLDEAERGFSYRFDAPLDMRMDQRNPITAADIVNGYSEGALFRMIRDYGEDRFAQNIAKHIVHYREKKRIESTLELSEIISAAIPARIRATGGHPAKRSFQAIRIELNRELEVLENTIDAMIDALEEGGRLCIITFHSLEDRIVKNKFKNAENPCICPPDFPVCTCGRVSKGRVITKKAILPSERELAENRRSQSAKLRIFERNVHAENIGITNHISPSRCSASSKLSHR
ncbi:MAG: 16S rRNA (cytosine(1402)-N(4))-methyltransferase RsmH [Oribacterium sp.]